MLDALTAAALATLMCAALSTQAGSAPARRGDALARATRDANQRWADQAFSARPQPPAIDRLVILHDDEPGTCKINRAAAGMALRLGEKTYKRGIGTNSLCVLRVTLSKPAARLLADIGLDRNVDDTTPASVRFRVEAGGKDAFATPVMRPKDGVRSIDVPLAGAREFDLIVDDGGDGRGWDQGDWCDARVVLQDGNSLWLDDLARGASERPGLPFSFVYGGKPSAELLPTWKSQVRDESVDATTKRRTLTFTDPATGLEVSAAALIYSDTPGVDWTLHFTNRGAADTPIIEQVRALDMAVLPGADAAPVLRRLHGSAVGIEDWSPIVEPLAQGKRVQFGSVEGRATLASSAFWTLSWGSGGVVTGFGWSGDWSATAEHKDGAVRVQAGMEGIHLKLRPGESIRSPRILQVRWSAGSVEEGENLFRRAMLAHIVPKHGGKPVMPPIVHMSTSFYELNASTEANTLSHLEPIKGLGFEQFWLDAYWTRDGFPAGMGHYGFPLSRAEPPDRFPHGLKPVSDAAHKAGMGFLVWFEPERVAPNTHIAKEHPEWVISPGGDGSGLFNLGIPEAREFMTAYLKAAIREYGLDWLRIDYNLNPGPYWQHLSKQDPDRAGLGEIRYMEGLYRMWDDLLAEYPGLAIDNCASGGTRIDLETCARSVPLWRTDDTIDPLFRLDFDNAALRNQVMSHGLNRYVPYSTVGQMGADPYHFRSGFNGGISFGEDCRPEGYPRRLLSQAIAEGKRLRKYWLGDFHPISAPSISPSDWCVMQYHRPAEEDGLVLAFRRPESPYAAFVAELRGIDRAATYTVTRSVTYKPGKPETMTGAQLRSLRIDIGARPGSVVVEYRRVGK